MNIIIAGIGKTGISLTKSLALKGHDIVAVDLREDVLAASAERYDILTAAGNCLTVKTLNNAGIEHADLLIAVTGSDETNLLCCLIARRLNRSLHTIPRVRNPEYLEQLHIMREDFGVSIAINPDMDAAGEMFKMIQLPGFLKRESFARSRVEIVELKVGGESPLVDASLAKLPSIIGCKALVCAVTRGKDTFIPGGGDKLLAGDHVFLTAPVFVLSKLLANLGVTTKKIRNTMIIGGGRQGFYLARMLVRSGVSVKVIEQKEERCRLLAQELPQAVIVCADGSSQEVLESEGLTNMDAIVTLTGFDEINMIISLYASSRGVGKIITKINRIESTDLFEKMETGSIINSARLSENNVAQYVSAMENQTGAAVTVHSIANDRVVAMEFVVDAATPYIDTPLKDIPIKKNALISCISHNGRTVIPDGSSSFAAGDTVVVVCAEDSSIMRLNDIFTHARAAR